MCLSPTATARYWFTASRNGGESCFPRLRGMFAFVLWNPEEGSVFIARDYFGIKPMHYTVLDDGSLVYGSEIKSILAHPGVVKAFNPGSAGQLPVLSVRRPAGNLF